MPRAAFPAGPIAVAAGLALAGCAATVEVPRRSPGLLASTGGGGAEAVFDGAGMTDADEGWEATRRDVALAIREPDDGLNQGVWPAPRASSLSEMRRLWLHSSNPDTVLYMDYGSRDRRRSTPWWWGW